MSPDSKPAASSTLKLLASMKVSDIWRKMSPLKHAMASTGLKGCCVSHGKATRLCVCEKSCRSVTAKGRQCSLITARVC